jgi:hypothetical protein
MRTADLRRRISTRASLLQLFNGQGLSRSASERLAATQLANERRQRPKPSPTAPAMDKLTPQTARKLFSDYLDTLAQRLRAAPVRRNRLRPEVNVPTVVLPHTADLAPINPAPALATATEPVLVFTGRSSAVEFIDDREFDPRWRESIATRSWRASIEHNEKLRREREQGRYIGLSR